MLQEIRNPKQFQARMEVLRRRKKTIGFVPTMGALHAGHISLVKTAGRENDIVAVSIFVNPTQFGPKEDFSRYPRMMAHDLRLLKNAGVDYVFSPTPESIYGPDFSSWVEVGGHLDTKLCGKFRPGHFRGVATVVAKLFNLAKPHRAYFGAKDYQQCAVIRRMIQDLDFDIEFRMMPTVREKDGLAMSSRNQYLCVPDRFRARIIPEVLNGVRAQINSGNRNLTAIKNAARQALKARVDQLDYLEIVDPKTLISLKRVQPEMVALTACFVGKTRLIDNVIINTSRK